MEWHICHPFNLIVYDFSSITGIITYYILMERSLRIDRKDWLRLVAVGIVGTTMYQTMFMLSVKYTSATNASLLIAMSPILQGY